MQLKNVNMALIRCSNKNAIKFWYRFVKQMRGRGTSTSLVIIRIEIKKIYDKPCYIVHSNFLREGESASRLGDIFDWSITLDELLWKI